MRKLTMILMLMLMASLSMAQGFTSSGGGGGASQADIDAALGDITYHQTWALPFTNAPSPAYVGGFYDFSSADVDFNPAGTWGIATVGPAAHFMVVCAAGDKTTELTVTGTSITDAGVRTESDSEVLQLVDDTLNAYYETSKKWLGVVTVEKTAGTDRLVNYGWCKYWDNRNSDFTMVGGEATWMGDRTAVIDLLMYHHKATGWTYSSTTVPTPPEPIFKMSDAHGIEVQTRSDVYGAYKGTGEAGVLILGSASEGVIIGFVFDTGGALEYGQVTMDYKNE